MLVLSNEVYLDNFGFEFNEVENRFFVSFKENNKLFKIRLV